MCNLREMEIVAIDCQTTGANPRRGVLIDLAWCSASALRLESAEPLVVKGGLVGLGSGEAISHRVQRITGITAEMLNDAEPAAAHWQKLRCELFLPGGPPRSALAHFAAFERPFIEALAALESPGSPCPRFLCTHEIARRLLPGLPRAGLRAVAGFLGHPLPEQRRSAEHVQATLLIWRELVRLLELRGIGTDEALTAFLAQPKPARPSARTYAMPREKRLALPDRSGVYRFLGSTGGVLYVGKATSLKARVSSYFTRRRGGAEHTLEMISQVHDVSCTTTESALEAALLEADLIKQFDPPYNRSLKPLDKTVWFADRSLRSFSEAPLANCSLGPFPSVLPLERLRATADAALGQWDEGATCLDKAQRLGFHDAAKLDEETLCLGISLFARLLGPVEVSLERLLGWGAIFASRPVAAQPDDLATTAERREWTPSRVCWALAHNASWAGALWMRAHWLTWLTECSLTFHCGRESRNTVRCARLLELSAGRVQRAADLEEGRAAPVPEAWQRPIAERRRVFDRATYDRLRVLLTELAALVASKAAIELVLSPRHRFDRAALEKLFLP